MTPLSEPLLVVDSDAPGRMALDAGLRQAGFAVETAADVEEALRKARQKIPALVVSETALKTSDGFELCRRLKEDEQLSQIPFLFVTHNKSIEGKIQGLEVGSVGYVTKPVSLNQLLEHIRQVLSPQDAPGQSHPSSMAQGGFSGALADMSVSDLVQTFEVGRKSGTLRIDSSPAGSIFFVDGKIVDAECGQRRAEKAFYRLLLLQEGRFDVQLGHAVSFRKIESSTQSLLMEGMRRLDEWNQLAQRMPPLSSVLHIDAPALAQKLSVIPDDVNELLRLCDGHRTLWDIIDATAEDALDVLRALCRLIDEKVAVDALSPVQVQLTDVLFEPAASELSTLETPTSESTTDPVSAIEITLEEAEAESNPLELAPSHLMDDWDSMEEAGLDRPTAQNPISAQIFFEEAENHSSANDMPARSTRVMSAARDRRRTTADFTQEDEFTAFARQQKIRKWAWALGALGLVALVAVMMNWLLQEGEKASWVAQTEVPTPVPAPLEPPSALPRPSRATTPVSAPSTSAPIEPAKATSTSVSQPSPAATSTESAPDDNFLVKGRKAQKAKNYKEAAQWFRKELATEPDSTEAQLGLGISLSFSEQNFSEAARLLELALNKEKGHPEGWYALGLAYQLSNREEKAWKAYKEYLKLAPKGPYAEEVRSVLVTNRAKVQ